MQIQMCDPMVLLHTALTLQSSVPKAHSSVSESKYKWNIDRREVNMVVYWQFSFAVSERGTINVHLHVKRAKSLTAEAKSLVSNGIVI